MGLVVAFLVSYIHGSDMKVPPVPMVKVGQTILSNYSVMFAEGESSGRPRDREGKAGYSSAFGSQMKRVLLRLDSNGDRVYAVTQPNKPREWENFELQTDSSGRSIACRSTNARPDELDRFAIMLRQPLWPSTEVASKWTYMIPSIRPGEKPIEVHCSVTSEGEDLLKLKQVVDSVVLSGGNTYIEVTLLVNQVTGRIKRVYEWVEHGGKNAKNPATAFAESY